MVSCDSVPDGRPIRSSWHGGLKTVSFDVKSCEHSTRIGNSRWSFAFISMKDLRSLATDWLWHASDCLSNSAFMSCYSWVLFFFSSDALFKSVSTPVGVMNACRSFANLCGITGWATCGVTKLFQVFLGDVKPSQLSFLVIHCRWLHQSFTTWAGNDWFPWGCNRWFFANCLRIPGNSSDRFQQL